MKKLLKMRLFFAITLMSVLLRFGHCSDASSLSNPNASGLLSASGLGTHKYCGLHASSTIVPSFLIGSANPEKQTKVHPCNAIKTTGVLGAVNTKTIGQAAKDPCSLAQTTGNIASTSQLGNSAQALLSGNFQQGAASALQALNAKNQAAAKEKQCRDLMGILTGSSGGGSSVINNSGANLLSSGGGALSGLSSLTSSGGGLSGISKLFNGVNLSKLLSGALNTPNPLLPPV